MARKQPASAQAPESPREMTPKERAALDRYEARLDTDPPRVRMRRADDGKFSVDHEHEAVGWLLMSDALGSDSEDFQRVLIFDIANAVRTRTEVDLDALNFGLAVVQGIQPRDQLEAMLAAQMAAVHKATLSAAGLLAKSDTVVKYDSAERSLNKLARTFAAQLEALDKHRRGGQQTVKVEHVYVAPGGQAIVGNVTHGGPTPERFQQPHEQHEQAAIEHSLGAIVPEMRSADQAGHSVSSAGAPGENAVQTARRR